MLDVDKAGLRRRFRIGRWFAGWQWAADDGFTLGIEYHEIPRVAQFAVDTAGRLAFTWPELIAYQAVPGAWIVAQPMPVAMFLPTFGERSGQGVGTIGLGALQVVDEALIKTAGDEQEAHAADQYVGQQDGGEQFEADARDAGTLETQPVFHGTTLEERNGRGAGA